MKVNMWFLKTTIIFLMIATSTFATYEISVRSLDENLQATLDFLKDFIKNKLPIKINKYEGKWDTEFLTGYLSLTDIILNGIADFEYETLTYNEQENVLDLGLNFPKIPASLDYEGRVTLFDFIPLFGNGNIKIDLENFKIQLRVKFVVIAGDHKVDDLAIDLSMKKSDIAIHGLQNDKEISTVVSEELSEIIPRFLDEKGSWINDLLTPYLINIINTQDLNDMFE